MRSGFRITKRLAVVLAGAGLLSVLWVIAASFSSRPLVENLFLVMAQTLLGFFALLIFFMEVRGAQSVSGSGLLPVLAMHVMLYYGLGNVAPALFPGPDLPLANRIPPASAGAYALGSMAAILFLLGVALGSKIVCWLLLFDGQRSRSHPGASGYTWLPSYRVAFSICVILIGMLSVGTGIYGLEVDNILMPEDFASFSVGEVLFFNGVIIFMPAAPLLAASAYVQAEGSRKRRAGWLLVMMIVLTVSLLAVWRMRSTAMLAVLLPVALLIYTGKVRWQRTVLPVAILISLAYASGTIVRLSELPRLFGSVGPTDLRVTEMIYSLMERPGDDAVLGRLLYDTSYHAAGLEAVAALLEAQTQGQLEPKWGVVIRSGFLQALPARLRPEYNIPERVKTAPANYGIFREGDWVATVLAEFVLDFGPAWLFFPAVLAGVGLTLMDRLLLRLGRQAGLQGLIVLRLTWLVTLVGASSLADMSLLFFKATMGYTVVLLLLGSAVNMRFAWYHRQVGGRSVSPQL